MARKEGKILVIDDNEGILKSLRFSLKYEFEEVKAVKNPNLIPGLITSESFDVILLDMNFRTGVQTGNEGIFWLNEILKMDPDAVVVLITAYGDVELAVRAIKEGATDFVLKPWDAEKLISTIRAAYKLRQSKREVIRLKNKQLHLSEETNKEFTTIIGDSPVMKELMKIVHKISVTDANVLILGENGTGKELIAREIHRLSNRSSELFISVDLNSLSEGLFESELFGHVKGAFTDAKEDRTGRFESASGGTLFLDEIGNLPISLQTKLLTVLQNRIISRVGSNKPIPVDIRLISATNKPVHNLIDEGLFREDLYFRINTIEINMPPLRSRGNDILLLAEYFMKYFGRKYEKSSLKINASAIQKLLNYHWPGNVRELRHTIEKAVILSDKNILTPEDFYFSLGEKEETALEATLKLDDVEKVTIQKALDKHRGNLSNTARELGITRKTLYAKIEKYGL